MGTKALFLSAMMIALSGLFVIPNAHASAPFPLELSEAAYSAQVGGCSTCHLWGNVFVNQEYGAVTGPFESNFGVFGGKISNPTTLSFLFFQARATFYADTTDYLYVFMNYWIDGHLHASANAGDVEFKAFYRVFYTKPDGSTVDFVPASPTTMFENNALSTAGCAINCHDLDQSINATRTVSKSTQSDLGSSPLNAGYSYTFEYSWQIYSDAVSADYVQGTDGNNAWIDTGEYNPTRNSCLVLSWASNPTSWCTAAPPSGGGGGGGSGGGSLARGTQISMADGTRKQVQRVGVGERMLGFDPSTGRYGVSTVEGTRTVITNNELVIDTSAKSELRTDNSTTEVLWTKLQNGTSLWLPVTQLRVGDSLYTPGGWTQVKSIQYRAGTYVMYDITATMPYFANGYLDPPRPS